MFIVEKSILSWHTKAHKAGGSMWSKILSAIVITIFFPWSLLVMILLYGWDRTFIIIRELTADRYVLIILLVVAVLILQFVVQPPL
jgi:hypothetical protein